MRLGIGSYTYTWAVGFPGSIPEHPLTAMELLDRAARLGMRVVQFCDNLPLDRLAEADLATFARRAGEFGVEVELGTRGIRPDHLVPQIQLAERMRSRILRVVVDAADHKPGEDEVVALLKQAVPDLERAGICLAVENHDRFKAAALARVMERVGSANVGICLDTVNSFGALEGPAVVVDALGPWTVNLHLKEFVVQRAGHMMGFIVEGRPAGQGQLDIPWLLGRLRALGRDPNAILEQWTPPAEALAATVTREDAWAVESLQYLRTLIPD